MQRKQEGSVEVLPQRGTCAFRLMPEQVVLTSEVLKAATIKATMIRSPLTERRIRRSYLDVLDRQEFQNEAPSPSAW